MTPVIHQTLHLCLCEVYKDKILCIQDLEKNCICTHPDPPSHQQLTNVYEPIFLVFFNPASWVQTSETTEAREEFSSSSENWRDRPKKCQESQD